MSRKVIRQSFISSLRLCCILTFDDSSVATNRANNAGTSRTTQPKKTLNADWRSRIQPLQRDNLLGAASPSASKTASTSKVKGKKTAKRKTKIVNDEDDDDEDPIADALREKESGIEDEVLVERFQEGTVELDQVRTLSIFTLFISLTVSSDSFTSICSR